jgi:phosphatidylglycerol:prolipoprotein diacylglycerol transferase
LQPYLLGIDIYAAATVLGYGFSVVAVSLKNIKDGRRPVDLIELALVVVLSAVLGAKIFHTLFESAGHTLPDGSSATGLWDLLKADPWHWARLFEAGYVFYGGVVGGIAMGYLFCKRAGFKDMGDFGDYAALGLSFGIFVGRLGCFMAGCCYGTPTDVPWAVVFPEGHPSDGAHIHPVQLYDAAFGLVAFIACVWFYKRRKFPGDVFARLILVYAFWRFGTEMFRGDADRGVWAGGALSTSQLVSLATVPVTLFFWIKEGRRRGVWGKGGAQPVAEEVDPSAEEGDGGETS